MEDWFIKHLARLRLTYESLRYGVHWAFFESEAEEPWCTPWVQARERREAVWQLRADRCRCVLSNRGGRPVLVLRGEPVSREPGSPLFVETRLLETGETAEVAVCLRRSLADALGLERVADELAAECRPGPTDCGLVVVVRGMLVRLEWFGQRASLLGRANHVFREAVMLGLGARVRSGCWTPGRVLESLGGMRWGDGLQVGIGWYRPFRMGRVSGMLAGEGQALLHLRVARPGVFDTPTGAWQWKRPA